MRLATLQTSAPPDAVPAIAARDGSWIPLAALLGSRPQPLAALLPSVLDPAIRVAERAAAWTGPRLPPDGGACLPPIPEPPSFRDFYAFEAHVKTARARRGLEVPAAWYELPVFYFSNPRALVGQGAAVFAPAGCTELDYELELGVVIGRGGRDIPMARAWDHVAGFTILNDLSARDLQRREMTVGLGPAKGKDFATAVGPWLVTRDEFADRIDGEKLTLAMCARVNGRELSRGNTADLHHAIPRLVAQASRDADLFPGDLLGTGTVGTGCILELGSEHAGGWLEPGDTVELEIERLGVLRTRIVARPTGASG
jgi:2-keto-4-pentenoate hydratase/2-oxohepta-3-ene-1,7-dioic acid hydratase in catechol pathway